MTDRAKKKLTILMPCLNEERSIATCVKMAMQFLTSNNIDGEVLVADNNSTDRSAEIARDLGARVITVRTPGNGATLLSGIKSARGQYIIMGDADGSYDLYNLAPFLQQLEAGADLVNGNRFKGGITPGAMPFLHQYLGNPMLSWLGGFLFNSPLGDFHCGLKGLRRAAILKLPLRTMNFNFCSELIVQSIYAGYKITEVPTTLSPDLRDRKPHLKTWRDGIKNLSFMLSLAPMQRLLSLCCLGVGVLSVAVVLVVMLIIFA